MNTDRIAHLKTFMDGQNLDALVFSMPGHIMLTSGFWPLNNGLACYILPLDGRPLCIVPHCEAAEAAAELWGADLREIGFGILDAPDYDTEFERILADRARDLGLKRIGIDLGVECFAPAWNAAEIAICHHSRLALFARVFGQQNITDVSGALAEMKQTKNVFEIGMIRRTNEIARIGLTHFRETVDVGRSGLDLRSAVETAINVQGTGYQGARRVRAFAQVSTGAEETRWGFRPMLDTTARKLESGDTALLELAVVADGYWADRTQPVVAGKASARQEQIYALVKQAQDAVITGVRPGITCAQADAMARCILDDAGFQKEFLHVTGHGIGFQYHDPGPVLMPDNDSVLQSGAVFTVEPGIYQDGFGGVRIEDNVALTVDGADVLGRIADQGE